MNSPEKTENQVLGLLSVTEAKTFLIDCVNLPNPIDYPRDNRDRFERWLRKWQRWFTFDSEDEDGKWHPRSIPKEQLELFAPVIRTTLCRLWAEPDARQRDWYFYRLRDAHRQMVRHLDGWEENSLWGGPDTPKRLTDYALQDVPKLCPFEAAIYWLQLNQKLMLRCPGPLCAAPYFFREDKGQKFCSPECADPARREAKLRWWNEHRKTHGKPKKSLR
ncbi:MAG: hypothetical protein WA485_20105 [Candidatus Sulfotelmatobacter sp.]